MRRRPLSIMLLVSAIFALSLIAVGTRLGAQEGTLTEGETPSAGDLLHDGGGSLHGGGEPAVATFPAAVGEMATLMPTATIPPTATQLSTAITTEVVQPQSVIGRDIAYSTSNGVKVKDANGNAILTNIPNTTVYPVWSINGLQIAYLNILNLSVCDYDTLNPTSNPPCYGNNATTIVPRLDNRYWDVAWSPNLSRLAFVLTSASGRVDIFVSGRDGSNLQNVTLNRSTVVNISPAWSADGNLLAFAGVINPNTANFDIYVYNFSANSFATITTDGASNRLPFWERTSNKLGFRSSNFICAPSATCVVDNYLSPVIRTYDQMIDGTNANQWGTVWSPDGSAVRNAYMSSQTGNWEVYVGTGINISNDASTQDEYPKWRPTMEEALRLFNVYIAIDSTDTMLRQHLTREVLIGVEDIAKALNNQFVNIPGSYLDAFIEVMNAGTPPSFPISFVFYPRSLACLTANGSMPSNTSAILLNGLQPNLGATAHQSVIECNINFGTSFTRYTTVHELGHTFVGVTGGISSGGGTFYGLVQNPILGPIAGIVGVDGNIVMGTFGEISPSGQSVIGWVRGQRGWGSSDDLKPANSNNFLPACDFQQNPLNVAQAGPNQEEVDEAAADIVLHP